jgi:nucleotide-binding universal stress UspA family protein
MSDYLWKSTLSGYASIMVPMDLQPEAEARAKIATSLADRFGSRLIGVAAYPLTPPVYFEAAVPGIESAMDLEKKRATHQISKAEALFRKAAGTRNRVEWRHEQALPSEFISEQARAADLIVASRAQVRDWIDPMSADTGDLVMAAGRPVLVVPPDTELLTAKSIVIAWKDTREARRAVIDALPFLKASQDVTVVAFGGDDRGAMDVSAYLTCHGIAAAIHHHPMAEHAIAEELARVASNDAADLIVCGAYGHSRASEWMFGGVTRDLLAHTRLCCLMSH